jgi:hypothetical protein
MPSVTKFHGDAGLPWPEAGVLQQVIFAGQGSFCLVGAGTSALAAISKHPDSKTSAVEMMRSFLICIAVIFKWSNENTRKMLQPKAGNVKNG